MQIQGLSKKAREWLKGTAIHFGCTYRGRASVRKLMEELAAGRLEIRKIEDPIAKKS